MELSALTDFGLSTTEAKVYLALLELGYARAGAIIKKLAMQNSVAHATLQRLVEKGLISYVSKDNTRHYQAADPEVLLRVLDERRSKIAKAIPALQRKRVPFELLQAQVFEGFAGFKSLCYSLIEDAEPGDEYLFFSLNPGSGNDYHEVFDFYGEYEKERERRGIIVKGLAPESLKPYFKNRRKQNLRFVKVPTIQNLSIFRNKVLMTPWGDRQVSFLITSQQQADDFRRYFYMVWEGTKAG